MMFKKKKEKVIDITAPPPPPKKKPPTPILGKPIVSVTVENNFTDKPTRIESINEMGLVWEIANDTKFLIIRQCFTYANKIIIAVFSNHSLIKVVYSDKDVVLNQKEVDEFIKENA